MFVQISTDNQIKSDAESHARLEERVRDRLKRFEKRLTHVELHVEDVNGQKGGDADKRVSLEARPAGHEPIAVHAEAGHNPSAGLIIEDNVASVVPGFQWSCVLVGDWSGEPLVIRGNRLGERITPFARY